MNELGTIAGQLEIPDIFTPTGLNLPDNLSHDDWLEVGRFIARAHRAVGWWIGDWLVYGQDHGYLGSELV